jgi:thiopurine S-methyltransferase
LFLLSSYGEVLLHTSKPIAKGNIMDHEFWHARWERKETGFHQESVNHYLHEHWPDLTGPEKSQVLVPLCGKSHDLWWLHDRGHPILGVELSRIACKDFFEEAGEKAMVTPGSPFTRFRHDDTLELWCGDFYQLSPTDVSNIRWVYDRAALIALPPLMRQRYASHLSAILPESCGILLITLDYDGSEMTGPPFNVTDNEVYELFSDDFTVERLRQENMAKDDPFAKRKGLGGATESVFLLYKR